MNILKNLLIIKKYNLDNFLSAGKNDYFTALADLCHCLLLEKKFFSIRNVSYIKSQVKSDYSFD